jgi:hypothetical protein
MMKLPTRKTEIETDLSKYTIFIYGREKIGKTSLAAQFPDALFLMFEPGSKSLEIFRMEINSWVEFVETCKLLKESTQYKTIVIDTVDLAFKYCSDYMCKKLVITHPSDEEWGKAWGLIRDEFTQWMSYLGKLNRGVIFISHAAERDIKRLKGDGYLISPTLAKQGRTVIEPMVDIWGYYGYEGKDRFLQLRGNEEINAGCRLTQNFIGIEKISMGNTVEQAYKNFMAAFNTKKGGVVKSQVETAVQTEVIKKKFTILKKKS